MKMSPVIAMAALVIGCDDDKSDLVDATDTSEAADEASEVSETTPETFPDTVSEIEPDTVSEIEPDTVSEVEPDTVSEVEPDTVSEVEPDTASDVDAVEPDPIELVGVWSSGFGDETITATNWDGFCIQAIVRFDNDENVAILETISGQDCLKGFSRVVWNDIVDDTFDYCTTTYAAVTADDAANAEVVNFSNDLMTGCGGFPWSSLTRK